MPYALSLTPAAEPLDDRSSGRSHWCGSAAVVSGPASIVNTPESFPMSSPAMDPLKLSQRDESFLDEVFDLSIRCRANGEALDLDSLTADRPHLEEHVRRILDLAREVAVAVGPQLRDHDPSTSDGR